MHVVEQRLSDVPRANFGLDGIWEDCNFIDLWLTKVGKVYFVAFMCKVVVFVLSNHSFLIKYKIVSLLKHEVHNRMSLHNFSDLISPIHHRNQEECHKEIATENGKALNRLTSEVRVKLHVENPQQKGGQKEERDYSMQVFLPKRLSDELLAPFLQLLVWRFLA